MDIGRGLILQNCLWSSQKEKGGRVAAGEMKEKKEKKKEKMDKKAKKWKCSGEKPVAERHDGKKHEDSADANDKYDHHDHCVAVALFYYSHKDNRDKHAACKNIEIWKS